MLCSDKIRDIVTWLNYIIMYPVSVLFTLLMMTFYDESVTTLECDELVM